MKDFILGALGLSGLAGFAYVVYKLILQPASTAASSAKQITQIPKDLYSTLMSYMGQQSSSSSSSSSQDFWEDPTFWLKTANSLGITDQWLSDNASSVWDSIFGSEASSEEDWSDFEAIADWA